MELKRQKKKLRKQYQNAENVCEKTIIIIERIKLIKVHITNKMKENYKELCGILNDKFRKKSNTSCYHRGKITESNIHPRFYWNKEHYKNLLGTGHSETAEETQLECKVEKEFQQISKRQGDKKERTTQNIIRKAIRKMTNKKAPDRLSCKTGWIKEGG